jgi:quercetin 2,3-dioxygenase
MEKYILHAADSRGQVDFGWLKSFHTFSFGHYHNEERVHFGALRVLNDDIVAPGMGFGKHGHDNMEIISIPLSGNLEHSDNMGHQQIIKAGDVQVMSAGTGIEHSEKNENADIPVDFLQIWVIPNKRNVEPRYQQITLDTEKLHNQLHQIVSPNPNDDGVWIHQNAWFNMGNMDSGTALEYQLKDKSNGVYAFLLEGSLSINTNAMQRRDGMAISGSSNLIIKANERSSILLMEVPLII